MVVPLEGRSRWLERSMAAPTNASPGPVDPGGITVDPIFITAWPVQRSVQHIAKRALDAVVASAVLAVLAPLLFLVSLVIKVESTGPALISQRRVGKDLRPFSMYKLRSMRVWADEPSVAPEDLVRWRQHPCKLRTDPRVTRFGRFLRRTSIDELPQLVNVIRGEMSLVGPRPLVIGEVLNDPLRQAARLRVRPGMTGLWQVSGRSLMSYDEMIDLDLEYVRTWSVPLDLRILMRTVPAVLVRKGAY
jgi:lipopolysaccharide/colanic/teichoic acid biosynthesis glycosyltransferase